MTFPKNWEKTKMGDIGRYLNGKAFKSEEWKSTGRPIIRIQNLTGSGSEYNYFQGEVENRYVVMPGDLLFSWSATLGTYIWQGPEAVLNQHIFKVESYIDKKFHRYLLDFKIQEMQSQTHGSGMVHITKKSFDAIEVHIPPIDEQNKIVELLEDHLSRLDAALADVKQAKLKAAQFKVAFLRNVFSGDASWNSIPMKQLGKWGGGGTPSKANEKFWTDGTVPWLSPKDMGPLEITQTVDKITEEACLNSTVKKIPENSVVFVVRSGILERKLPIALTKVETTLNQDMKALTFSDKVNPKFGFYSMLGLEQDILRTCRKSGTTVASINTESLMNYEIKIPSLPVQAEILDYVDSQLTLIDNSVPQVESVLKVGNSLRRSLLQAAFTGQLTKEVVSV